MFIPCSSFPSLPSSHDFDTYIFSFTFLSYPYPSSLYLLTPLCLALPDYLLNPLPFIFLPLPLTSISCPYPSSFYLPLPPFTAFISLYLCWIFLSTWLWYYTCNAMFNYFEVGNEWKIGEREFWIRFDEMMFMKKRRDATQKRICSFLDILVFVALGWSNSNPGRDALRKDTQTTGSA